MIVRTPKGKCITMARYLALTRAQQGRDHAAPCVHHHFGCAAWAGGPCSDEHGLDNHAED